MKNARFIIITAMLVLFQSGCNRPSVSEQLATSSFLEGNWNGVVEYGNQWVEENQENPVPHALLNIAYTKLDKHDALKRELNKAYDSKENIEIVLSWAKNLSKEHPDNAKAYLLEGLAYEIYGDNDVAINCYKTCIRVEPNFEQGYQSLGNLYMSNRWMNEAILTYEELLKNIPNNASAYCSIGTVYALMHNMDKAIENLEKAVEIDPKDLDALYNLSMAYLESDNVPKGVVTLLTITQLDPDGKIGRDARNYLNQMIVK